MALGQGDTDPTNRPGGSPGSGTSWGDPDMMKLHGAYTGFGESNPVKQNIKWQNWSNADTRNGFLGLGGTDTGMPEPGYQAASRYYGTDPFYQPGGNGYTGPPPPGPGGPPQIPGGWNAGAGGGGGPGTLAGLDFTQPGALEQYQHDHASYFNQPTLSESFAKDAINQGAGPAPTNRAEQAFQTFNSSNPADMDPYYANERRKLEENVNRTMAARGAYGSSAANDMIGEGYTNLAADEAKANAAYGLQRGSLLGSLGSGADQSSLAGSADRRNWTSALSNIADQGDTSGLARVLGGANVAGSAQIAQTNRGQNAFNNQLAMGDRMSGILGTGYGNLFGNDQDLMKTIIGLNSGVGAEGYNQASQTGARNATNASNLNNQFGTNVQLGTSLYDMFNKPSQPNQPIPMPAPATSYNSGELPRNPYVYP